jgi:hypothetical protein
VICIFARRITDELAGLVKRVDEVVGKSEGGKLAAFVVFLTDDPESGEQELRSLADRTKISRVPLTVFDGAGGPESYAIVGEATVNVMMWRGEKKLVRANYTMGSGTLDEAFIAKVVALAGDNRSNAVSVGVYNTPITIERLKHLGTLTTVEALDLQDVNLTAAGLTQLQNLTRLRSLNLFRNKRLTDAAIETLVEFAELEELNISSTQITDAGLDRISRELTELKRLNFRNSRQIVDAGLEKLLQRPELEALLCGNTSITDAGLAHLGKLSSLHELEIRKTKITNDGLLHIAKLTNLRKLNCGDNNMRSVAEDVANQVVEPKSDCVQVESVEDIPMRFDEC